MRTFGGRSGCALAAAAALGLVGCNGADAPKSWSALSSCLAGPAANAPVLERVQKLRAAELATSGAKSKERWPGRCNAHAEALYSASGDMPGLHRKLHEKVGCTDEPGHCALTADESLITTTTELWEAAQAAGLKAEA